MNKINFEKFKARISNYYKQHKHEKIPLKRLIRDLSINNKDVGYTKIALDDLAKDKIIERFRKSTFQFINNTEAEISGILQVTKSGPGFVITDSELSDIFINKRDLGNALHGDKVAVDITSERRRGPEGVITNVLERKHTTFVGQFEDQGKYGFVVIDNPKIHVDFFIPKKYINKAENGQKVVVELTQFDIDQRKPEGKIIEILGFPNEPGVDVISVFKSHHIDETFEKAVINEANDLKLDLEKELPHRLDLRDEMIFTIDPLDAKDFDDAISLTKKKNGNFVMGVHIADVSHYVLENSQLDKEAVKRGCSVYLVDRVIPMLPENLSNGLCSLRPNEDKLCYSAIMELDATSLDIVSYKIEKTVIHSKQRFTYEEVQDILDKKTTHDLNDLIHEMNDLALALRKKRFDHGSINFHSAEVRFELDEKGKPTGIIRKEQLQSMKLIEEFMLTANQCVAKHIDIISKDQDLEYASVYRVHEQPSEQKMDFLKNFLKGMEIDVNFPFHMTPKIFQTIMGPLLSGAEADIINDVAVRSMMKAKYSVKNVGHFGLAFKHYSHFTSPIRRYPDLILHRLLFDYSQNDNSKRRRHYRRILPGICELSSANEMNAQNAERDSIRLKQLEFMEDHLFEEFQGKISGVTEFGLYIEIEEYLIEGFVKYQRMKDDHYTFNAKTLKALGKSSGKSYHLGQKVKIQVAEINRSNQTIDFDIVN